MCVSAEVSLTHLSEKEGRRPQKKKNHNKMVGVGVGGARIHAAGEKVSLLPTAGGGAREGKRSRIAGNDGDEEHDSVDAQRRSHSHSRSRGGELCVGTSTCTAVHVTGKTAGLLVLLLTTVVVVLASTVAVTRSPAAAAAVPHSSASSSSSSSIDGFGGFGGGGVLGRWGPSWGLGGVSSPTSSSSERANANADAAYPSLGQPKAMMIPAAERRNNVVVRSPGEKRDPSLGQEPGQEGGESQSQSQENGNGNGGGGDDDDDALARLKEAATKSGFLLPLSDQLLEKNPWMRDAPHPPDLLLENVLNDGADALPDVAPGVPFDADDPEYDAEGWAHSPLPGRGYQGGRNKFKLCVDHADQWDFSFPEGWFQTMIDSATHQLHPRFCISEIIHDVGGSGCGDADVVLFNEGALIWHAAHRTADDEAASYVLPAKHHEGVVYIYFAHEAPAGFGSELLDKRLLDQFDYLAYSNEDGSSLWWSFLPSARHLVQDYEVYVRPFSERQPVLGWLAIDCGNSVRQGILAEISRQFPVWSVGSCRNNRAPDPDLPGRNMEHDDQRRRMQVVLSRYLFYFSAENSDCPGYTTEKLWMALSRGSIPVYFGDEDVHKYLPCEDCVLDVKKFASVDELVQRMRAIASDENEYNRITAWRFANPGTWPERFRRGIAVASADVNRLTCSVLKEGKTRYRPAVVQVTKTGGYNEKAAAGLGGGDGGGGENVDIYEVSEDTHPAVKVAAKAAEDGRALAPYEMNPLRARACNTPDTEAAGAGGVDGSGKLGMDSEGAIRIMGKLMKEYGAAPQDTELTPPEQHYDTVCDEEQKMACYRLKDPPPPSQGSN